MPCLIINALGSKRLNDMRMRNVVSGFNLLIRVCLWEVKCARHRRSCGILVWGQRQSTGIQRLRWFGLVRRIDAGYISNYRCWGWSCVVLLNVKEDERKINEDVVPAMILAVRLKMQKTEVNGNRWRSVVVPSGSSWRSGRKTSIYYILQEGGGAWNDWRDGLVCLNVVTGMITNLQKEKFPSASCRTSLEPALMTAHFDYALLAYGIVTLLPQLLRTNYLHLTKMPKRKGRVTVKMQRKGTRWVFITVKGILTTVQIPDVVQQPLQILR